MISEFNYPEREWQLYITNVDLDYFLKFIKQFELATQPLEKKISFWHETFAEYVLDEFKNNKIRIEYSDEIVTIMFTQFSDDNSKESLKNIAETMNDKIKAV
tara:strand:- start:108127 stop:108432 length:306 start_codon:yes stop_codon:yes gene_type:complete